MMLPCSLRYFVFWFSLSVLLSKRSFVRSQIDVETACRRVSFSIVCFLSPIPNTACIHF